MLKFVEKVQESRLHDFLVSRVIVTGNIIDKQDYGVLVFADVARVNLTITKALFSCHSNIREPRLE